MSHKIEQAYRDVKPPETLIAATLEQVKKQRLRRSVISLVLQCSVSSVVCIGLAFAMKSTAVGVGLFAALCLVFAVIFFRKNTLYLEEKFMSDDKAKLTDLSLDAVVGGTGSRDAADKLEGGTLITKATGNCPNCGTEIPWVNRSEPCPGCGFMDENIRIK